jgi:protein SCO1/2
MERKVMLVGVNILAVLLIVTAAVLFTNRKPYSGAVIEPPLPLPEISLTDQTGAEFHSSSLRGKIVLIYFGYTNCQEECPLTMAKLKQVLASLDERAAEIQVLMVSTDPARDTPQAMQEFLAPFQPGFLGLTGSAADLQKIWNAYGVTVLDGGETHSNLIYVIDRSGDLRLTFFYETQPADIAADLRRLLREE